VRGKKRKDHEFLTGFEFSANNLTPEKVAIERLLSVRKSLLSMNVGLYIARFAENREDVCDLAASCMQDCR
jgi:hypothetical protein